MERNVTTPLEQAIKTSSGVKEFDSFSNDGMSIITVEYEFGTDMKAKEAEVQQAVSGVQQTLPPTALAPEVAALNFNSMPVVQLAVSSSLPPQQLADAARHARRAAPAGHRRRAGGDPLRRAADAAADPAQAGAGRARSASRPTQITTAVSRPT